ncbi:hypothetical protein [Sphingomonas palmae]|uniref:hypothetical protein n=1 Tax=Sphingomonas palmae TaxID=1855283 RepID=UPI000B886C0C|nr:hypothetical protein [Sphingomonas palmae]
MNEWLIGARTQMVEDEFPSASVPMRPVTRANGTFAIDVKPTFVTSAAIGGRFAATQVPHRSNLRYALTSRPDRSPAPARSTGLYSRAFTTDTISATRGQGGTI